MRKKIIFLIICLLMFIPGVKAYGIENFYFNGTVEPNGDLIVEEYFDVNGSFNGYERIINYENPNANEFYPEISAYGGSVLHNGDGIEILEVKAVEKNSNFDFTNVVGTPFEYDSSASSGDFGVYYESDSSYGKTIRIFNPSSRNLAFYLKYRISNIAVKHNDVGEIGYNIPINELDDDIGHLKVWLHFPGNSNDLRVWAHGPLQGEVSKPNIETLYAYIDNPGYRANIDVRATFDLSVIPKSSKETNVFALDKILAYEEDMAARANAEREVKQAAAVERLELLINALQKDPIRSDYDEASSLINFLIDEELISKYTGLLMDVKPVLDKKEFDYCMLMIDGVHKAKTYKSYTYAESAYSVIDNEVNRKELAPLMEEALEIVKEAEKKKDLLYIGITCVLLVFVILLEKKCYKTFMVSPKAMFQHKYFRDFPSDYSPETVSYLFNKKILDSALSASLMNMINNKVIEVVKEGKDYKLIDKSSEHLELVSTSDCDLLKIVFHGEAEINPKEMNKYAKKHYSKFLNNWNNYNDTCMDIGKKQGFYETDVPKKSTIDDNKTWIDKIIVPYVIISIIILMVDVILGLFMFIGLVLLLFVNYSIKAFKGNDEAKKTKAKAIISYIVILCFGSFGLIYILLTQHFYLYSVIFVIGLMICTFIGFFFLYNPMKRTQKGSDEKAIWQALHNFLNDFGTFNDKETIHIKTWEKYLVYATYFGCAKKVLKQMKLQNLGVSEEYYENLNNVYVVNNMISHSVSSAHSSAVSAKSAAESSSSGGGSWSSGSGGGGGFSSGGGSFGGGGGGGRF